MQVRLKQGDIADALEEKGWTQAQGADFLGLSYERFNALLNLKWVPKRGFSPELTIKLYELTGKTVEELFPEWARRQDFLLVPKVARKTVEVGPHMLNGTGVFYLPPGPEQVFSQNTTVRVLDGALKSLGFRDEKVMRLLVFEGCSMADISRDLNLSRTVVNRIVQRSLGKLHQRDDVRSLIDLI